MATQVDTRRVALRSILTSAIVLTGCDFRNRYSENTPVQGASWEWKARAKANPTELTEMARAVLATTPDSIIYKNNKPDGVIDWPRESPKIISGPNTWQISFFTSAVDGDYSELSMLAQFFRMENNLANESPPTPDAKQRLHALIWQLLQTGAKLGLSVTVDLHAL